jgi:hypothetical protein
MRKSIAAVIVVVFIVLGVVGVSFYLTMDNVTVSGEAGVTFVPGTIIQSIEFADIQTRFSTTYQFHWTEQSLSNAGNYTVTLQKGHTYNVYISFYVINPEDVETHFSTPFYVDTTAGQTAITKTFWYHN